MDGDAGLDLGIDGVVEAFEVGVGGFATVYRARQPLLDRVVAVKVIHAAVIDPSGGERFLREVKAAGRLSQHPNVVPIYDVGTTASRQPYLIMPYYERGSLAKMIEAGGALAEAETVRIGRTLANTLDYVHQRGVLHRDLKPANVLMADTDEPLICDFGVARLTDSSVSMHTTGTSVVTWAYGPPEAFTGSEPTVMWDIYSLGATLYTMLTGSPPFVDSDEANIFTVLNRIGNVEVPDLRDRGVSPAVADAVRRAMAKAPEDRPSSAAEFATLLSRRTPSPETLDSPSLGTARKLERSALEPPLLSPGATPPGAVSPPPPPPGRQTPAALASEPSPHGPREAARPHHRIRPAVWIAGVVAVLAIVAASFVAISTRRSDNSNNNAGPEDTQPITVAPSPSDASAETDPPTSASTAGAAIDLTGTTVNVLTSDETAVETDNAAFDTFEANTGAVVQVTGARDADSQVRLQVEAGSPPDIFFAGNPRTITDLGAALEPLPGEALSAAQSNFDPHWLELARVNGDVVGVPVAASVHSLVWYSPRVFSDNGYEVPQTWDALMALQEQMKTDGNTPWCIGIESGAATGWPFTNWMEDLMLRLNGPDAYDQWVDHEIPFNDPLVRQAAEMVGEVWFTDANVLGGRAAIASTSFGDAGLPVADGGCMMHLQADFYSGYFDPDTTFGPDGDIDAFYLPTITDDFGRILTGGGVIAVVFNDKPETQAVMTYLASAQYANDRIVSQPSGRYLSPNKNQDTSLYTNALSHQLAELLVSADVFRFDGSDLMPAEVGAGTFWSEGTNYVSGAVDLDTFLDTVESSWPTG